MSNERFMVGCLYFRGGLIVLFAISLTLNSCGVLLKTKVCQVTDRLIIQVVNACKNKVQRLENWWFSESMTIV